MANDFSTLVVVPTYNEKDNIINLLEAILNVNDSVECLVVDDSSPDGTAELVKQKYGENPRVHLLLRKEKNGLGRAYIAGFQWALERHYDWISEMDADFSHRPEDLKKIFDNLGKSDFVVGSRYIPGGATQNWGLGRQFISRGGNIYASLILGWAIKDWTGGFNTWSRKVLESIGLENINSNGYSFQIELKFKALSRGFRGLEVPILFVDREAGQSKMSFKIASEALYKVWMMRLSP